MVQLIHYYTASHVDDRRPLGPLADNFVGANNLSSNNDEYTGHELLFMSGPLMGYSRRISRYSAAPYPIFQFTGEGTAPDRPFPDNPREGDNFRIIPLL